MLTKLHLAPLVIDRQYDGLLPGFPAGIWMRKMTLNPCPLSQASIILLALTSFLSPESEPLQKDIGQSAENYLSKALPPD